MRELYGDTTTTADTSVPGLLTLTVITERKITMAQVKQMCKCQ